jgi:hypothetical protein
MGQSLSWTGSDGNGSGIATYDVYVSDDGGPFTLWQPATPATSATLTGQVGHTYAFYSVATSNVGLVQPAPVGPQATTTVSQPVSGPPSGPNPPAGPTGSTPKPTPPTIISEQPLFTRKLNKRHKPVGKPVLTGFELDFSTAMTPATAGNANNYQVAWMSSRRVKKKVTQVAHPVPFRVQYDAATHAVSLLLAGKQAFAQGGQITVIASPPVGVSDASGVLLDGNDQGNAGANGVFTILPKARGITRA